MILARVQVPLLNAGSMFGRIIPGLFVHTFGTINLATFFTIASSMVIVSMIAVKTFVATAVFGVLFGIFSGASIVLTISSAGMSMYLRFKRCRINLVAIYSSNG